MSLIEPPDDDEQWLALIGGLELSEPTGDDDYSSMELEQLIILAGSIETELSQIDNILHPRTEKGRELHSKYVAIQFHIKKKSGRT